MNRQAWGKSLFYDKHDYHADLWRLWSKPFCKNIQCICGVIYQK